VPRHSICSATLICWAFLGMANAATPAVHELVGKAMAATPDTQHGQILYSSRCTGCHGARAWGDPTKDIPSLAGQRTLYLVVQLADFALLERNGSEMHKAAGSADVGNAQGIRDLAAYLSQAPTNPQPGRGDGRALKRGKQLFQRQCAMCHGKNAEGSAEEPIPALAGQHYRYTLAQLKNFAAGHRGQVEPPVIDFTAGLSAQDQSGIADYLSRLMVRGP
jgi:cytochrome c553